MIKFTAPSTLNDFTVMDVIKKISDHPELVEIHIDFSNVRFAHPIGTLILSQFLKYCAFNKNSTIIAYAPTKMDVRSYLETVGFLEFIKTSDLSWRKVNTSKTYIPLSVIDFYEIKQRKREYYTEFREHKPLQEFIQEIANNYSEWIFDRVESTISYCIREIVRNSLEHSGAKYCSIFGQIFRTADRIEFCIADSGKGIFNSLAEKYDLSSTDEALRYSIKPGISAESVQNAGEYSNSGFGLYVLSEIAKLYGYMIIGSSDKALVIKENEIKVEDHYYPGTFVGFCVTYRDLLRNYSKIDEIIREGELLSRRMGGIKNASASTKKIIA